LKPSNRSTYGHLAALTRLIEDECRTVHATYVARRADLLAVCERARLERRRALDVARPQPVRVLSADGKPARTTRSTAADRTDPPSEPRR
jgi:hypothetical protein